MKSARRNQRPAKRSLRSLLGLLLRTTLILLIAITAAHGIWTWVAERKLQAKIDAIRALDEPIEPADFQKLDIDRPNSSAHDIDAATAILDDDSPAAVVVDHLIPYREIPDRAWPYLNSAADWFNPAIKRIDRATTKPVCQWTHSFQSPLMYQLLVPELNKLRSAGCGLVLAALTEHHVGRDDLVIKRFHQALFLVRACDEVPTPVGHLAATSLSCSVANRIEEVGPDLKIDGGNGGAQRREVSGLITSLLDDRSTFEGLRRSLWENRTLTLDLLRSVGCDPSNPLPWVERYLLKPIFDHDACLTLDEMSEESLAILNSPTWPSAKAKLHQVPVPSKWLPDLSLGSDERETQRQFEGLTDRHLAATALAIRLYVVEHQGALPANLLDLVPKYLPAIPADPMSPNGAPIHYMSRSDHPILYSVGLDGVDDGGSEAAMPDVHGQVDEWHRMDHVFYLSARPRTAVFVPYPPGAAIPWSGVDMRAPWDRTSDSPPATSQ